METFQIFNFAYDKKAKDVIESLGYRDREERPISELFSLTEKFYNAGINVMLYHANEGTVLFVDSKRFYQR